MLIKSSYFKAALLSSIAVATAITFSVANAQQRMTDKDVENTMKNLQEDAKKFRSSFDSAIGKSTIRKTSQEKEAKTLVKRFQDETKNMLSHFKSTKRADADLPVVNQTASQIDKLLSGITLNERVGLDWSKVKNELGMLSNAFGLKSEPAGSSE